MYTFIHWLYNLDYKEIIYAAFGAFVGFGLTIILEKLAARRENNEKKRLLINNILLELKDIKTNLEEIANLTESEELSELPHLFIDVPIYESTLQSGFLLNFIDEDYYIDIIRVYSQIRLLSDYEDSNAYSKEDIIETRNSVVRSIDSLIRQIDRCHK